MRLLSLFTFLITLCYAQNFQYQINNKKYKCNDETIYVIRKSIANGLDIPLDDITIVCSNFQQY